AGPDVGKMPPLEKLGNLDAIVLSHPHADHTGAIQEVLRLYGRNIPVYATKFTLEQLGIPRGIALPYKGKSKVLNIPVETGRSGHSIGGVWIRFGVEGGILYMGDSSEASVAFMYDPPPASDLVLFDASYGLYNQPTTLEDEEWERVLSCESVVFPVPANGRGLEFFVLFHQRNSHKIFIDETIHALLQYCLGDVSVYIKPEFLQELRHLVGKIEYSHCFKPRGRHVVANADASGGRAGEWVSHWVQKTFPLFVFTGYVGEGTVAKRLLESKRAISLRWNVHPTLEENLKLLNKAHLGVPCFIKTPEIFSQLEGVPAKIHWEDQPILF
ncbi:MAG: MBL fold metallo-hydrolase, partial [Spirochaetales bacterium]